MRFGTSQQIGLVVGTFAVIVPLGSLTDRTPGQVAYIASLSLAAALVLRSAIIARRAGRPWLFLGIGMGLWALAGTLTTLRWGAGVTAIPALSVDLLYVAGYVPAVIGLADMSEPTRRNHRLGSIVDGLIVFALIYGVLWLTVVQPLADHADLPLADRAFGSVYPAGDLALAMIVLSLRPRVDIERRVARLLCAGVLLSAAADTALLWLYLRFPDGSWGFTDLLYLSGTAMIAVAAMLSPHAAPAPYDDRGPSLGLRPRLVGCSLVVPGVVIGLSELDDRPVRTGPIVVWLLALGTLAGIRVMCYVRSVEDSRHELEWRSTHDMTTGMLDADAFLDQAGAGGLRERSGSLLLIDIDGFRDIRQAHGPSMAHRVLAAAADRMRVALPDDALLAMIGADEMLAFLRSTDVGRGRRLGEAVRCELCTPLEIDGVVIDLSVCIGVAHVDGMVIDLASGMRRCQQAVKHAKHLGPGHLVVDAELAGQFEPAMVERAPPPATGSTTTSAITPPLAVGALSSQVPARPVVARR